VTVTPIRWSEEYEPRYVVSARAAEATARKQLAAAKQLNIHDHTEMCISHGLLTTALGDLLDALEAESGGSGEAA
jgi:hypothetical protein